MQAAVCQRRRFGAGEHLAGIGDARWIEGQVQAMHAIDLFGTEHDREIVAFLDADAVLSGDGPAHLDAHLQNAARESLGPFECALLTAIEKDEWMEVSIAGMEYIGATDVCFPGHFVDAPQCLAKFAPRDYAILDDEVGREPADSAKGALAAFPNGQAFFGIAGGPGLEGLAGGEEGVERQIG